MNDYFNFKDKCQFVLYLIDKIEDYWKRLFYSTMTIVAALLGGVYTKFNIWPVIVILAFMFVSYTISNMIDHIRAYKFLLLAIEDVKRHGEKLNSKKILKAIVDLPYNTERKLCWISYIGVMVGIIIICVSLVKYGE